MLKHEIELSYDEFLKQYVKKPYIDYCISFIFMGNVYQFDYNIPNPTNIPGKTPYDFVVWKGKLECEVSRTSYKNLMDAINNARFEGLTFEEVYHSSDSELIDIS